MDGASEDAAPAQEESPCAFLLANEPGATSGVRTFDLNGTQTSVYCDMETEGGGWTRIAEIGPDVSCPSGWSTIEDIDACSIAFEGTGGQEVSAVYPTFGSYTQVRGVARGVQWFSTDAFGVGRKEGTGN